MSTDSPDDVDSDDVGPDEGVPCPTCGETFDSRQGMRIHHGRMHGGSPDRETVECEECGTSFVPTHASDGRFCSRQCAGTAKRTTKTLTCEGCGRTFESPANLDPTYCSKACMGEARTERPRPDDLEALLWLLYVYEGHTIQQTYLRANHHVEDRLGRTRVGQLLKENGCTAGRNASEPKYADLSPGDVGLEADQDTAQSEEEEEPAPEPPDEGSEAVPIEDLADDIQGLGDIAVENLVAAGFETAEDLQSATEEDLLDVGRVGEATGSKLLSAVGTQADDGEETADDSSEEDTNLEERIVELLDEHGELPASQIELLLEVSSSYYYNALSQLQREGRVVAREDPDDRRRNLYRLVEDDGDEEAEQDGETFPRECHCGATLEDSIELAIHRTEVHEVPQESLDHLEPGEFEAIVEDADSIQDVIDEVSWSTARVLRMFGHYGLEDVVGATGRELSDVADVSFEAEETGADPQPDHEGDEHAQAPDGGQKPLLDLEELGVTRDELVHALVDAQTVHHVRREVHHLSRDDVAELLETLGFLEALQGGHPGLDRDDVEQAVAEVTR